jgi:hypothetical protein
MPYSFNVNNKDAIASGNATVAMLKIQDMDSKTVWQNSVPTTSASITKSPYSAIGRLWRLRGQVYKVEELASNAQIPGRWSEILLLANNPNSPLGVTTVDFIYKGGAANINSEDYLTIAGYFVGTYESENAMGGKVEAAVIVGDTARH